MAFITRVGSILKETGRKHINLELLTSNPSVYQSIRCMSSSRLFVGARIIVDRDTGRSRGFGFVNYTTTEAASSAIQALDGKEIHGRWIKVNYASDRPSGPRPGGYAGEGYGGGGSESYGGAVAKNGSGVGNSYGNANYSGEVNFDARSNGGFGSSGGLGGTATMTCGGGGDSGGNQGGGFGVGSSVHGQNVVDLNCRDSDDEHFHRDHV